MSTTHLQQTAGAKGQDDKVDRRHLSLQYCSHQELYVSGKKKKQTEVLQAQPPFLHFLCRCQIAMLALNYLVSCFAEVQNKFSERLQ